MASPTPKLLGHLLAIALPMVISQATETINLFVGRLFLSRLGEAYLSAVMSGGLTSFMVSSLFVGAVGYTNAVVAQLFGAGRRERCAQAAVQGLILAAASYPIILAVSPLARYLFIAAGRTPLQVELGYRYFRVREVAVTLTTPRASSQALKDVHDQVLKTSPVGGSSRDPWSSPPPRRQAADPGASRRCGVQSPGSPDD